MIDLKKLEICFYDLSGGGEGVAEKEGGRCKTKFM